MLRPRILLVLLYAVLCSVVTREILEASSLYPPFVICAAGALYFVFPSAPSPHRP